jgi:hypothetical protein
MINGSRLYITSTAEDPFLIELHGLGVDGPAGWDSESQYTWLLVDIPESDIIGYDINKFSFSIAEGFEGAALSNFSFKLGSGDVYYEQSAVVPEPSTVVGIISGLLLLTWRRVLKRKR